MVIGDGHVGTSCCGPLLTQFADVFPELLERRGQTFMVGGHFNGIQHEGHAVDLFLQARPLPVAKSLRRIHWLNWTELREIKGSKKKKEREIVLGVTLATVQK